MKLAILGVKTSTPVHLSNPRTEIKICSAVGDKSYGTPLHKRYHERTLNLNKTDKHQNKVIYSVLYYLEIEKSTSTSF